MLANQICPGCGSPVQEDSAGGLCLSCLLKLGLHDTNLTTMDSQPRDRTSRRLDDRQEFGGYIIHRLIGRGGMGEVYEAEESATGRRVALKLLSSSLVSEQDQQRFLREGQLAAAINHPNSVYVYGADEINGSPVIAMELLPGRTLADRIKNVGPMTVAEAVGATLQIVAGLESALAKGILHRDIKPSNCFVDVEGTVKIGDYGLSIPAFSQDAQLTINGSFAGTPSFASPEQIRGKALDVRSDIYSVGSTLYFLLTGKLPFYESNLMKLAALIVSEPPVSPRAVEPDVPADLAAIVLRCLEKDPAARFGSYAELRESLLPFASSAPKPASTGLRFAACYLDFMLLAPIGLLVSRRVGAPAAGLVLLVYFFWLEGWYGASLGKRLCRLRVCAEDGRTMSKGSALWRAALFSLCFVIPAFLFTNFDPVETFSTLGNGVLPFPARLLIYFSRLLTDIPFIHFNWLQFVTLALLVVSQRLRGHYLHDLVTHTRVVRRVAIPQRSSPPEAAEPAIASDRAESVGPYRVKGILQRTETAELLVGTDERLCREVWIERFAREGSANASNPQNVNRPGRLRWLGGRQSERWNAYGPVRGTALVDKLGTLHHWEEVRHWLLDLAEEFRAGLTDGSLPATLGFDQIWISDEGATIVDLQSVRNSAYNRTRKPLSSLTGIQAFLHAIALVLLEGKATAVPHDAPEVPIPIRARVFIGKLGAAEYDSMTVVVDELRSLVEEDSAVSPGKRVVHLAAVVAVPVLLVPVLLVLVRILSVNNIFPPDVAFVTNILLFFLAAVPSVISGILFGGGLMRLFGLRIVDRRGGEASRTQIAVRNLVAWSPILLEIPLLSILEPVTLNPQLLSVVLLTVFLTGAWFAVRRPDGSLQDRIARTRLVPL